MAYIFHITTREDWQRAQLAGEYRAASLDSQGFIHCSNPEQVLAVANAFYSGQHELVLLGIDADQLASEVRYEPPVEGGSEELFPHVYGPINMSAVVKVTLFEPGPDGRFLTPGRTARLG